MREAYGVARSQVRADAGTISVLVAHESPLLAAGLSATLEADDGFNVTENEGQARSSLVDQVRMSRPDVVVADYETAMKLISALAAPSGASAMLAHRPKIVVVTRRDREAEIGAALRAGVHGYLLLSCGPQELVSGVRMAHAGSRYLSQTAAQRMAESLTYQSLTTRESEVLRSLASGMCNKSIASRLGISACTVKAHIRAIFEKLGASSRTEAMFVAGRRGLV